MKTIAEIMELQSYLLACLPDEPDENDSGIHRAIRGEILALEWAMGLEEPGIKGGFEQLIQGMRLVQQLKGSLQ